MSALAPVDGSPQSLAKKQWFEISDSADAWKKSQAFAKSNMVPKAYKDKPEDIMVAFSYGAEIGLQPMQSLKYIAIINGTPSVWGDALPALLTRSPDYEWHKQWWDEKEQKAHYIVKRKGHDPHEETFGHEDAKTRGYLSKDTYKTDLKGMCQKRARSAAIRNKFAEILLGLSVYEEEEDYQFVQSHQAQVTMLSDKTKERAAILGIDPPKDIEVEPQVMENYQPEEHSQVEPTEDYKEPAQKQADGIAIIKAFVEEHKLLEDLEDLLSVIGKHSVEQLSIVQQREIYKALDNIQKKKT